MHPDDTMNKVMSEGYWNRWNPDVQAKIDRDIEANRKAADAEAKRKESYYAFSEEMKSRGYGELDFTGDVDQQISDLMSKLAEMGDEGEADAMALGLALKPIGEATTEAAKAKAEADKLAEELEKDKQDYDEWVAAAEQLYGITASDADSATEATKGLNDALNKLPDQKRISILVEYEEAHAFPQAKGNDYVPYDNYPSLLHRGEMVLTASEANRYRSGSGGGSADLSGLEDRIISAIKSGMENATVRSYLNGRDITDDVNRRNMEGIKGRRFST